MSKASRARAYAQLQRELETEAYKEMLDGLKQHHPFFQRFQAWADILSFMRAGPILAPQKDEVLRPIFTAHAAAGDPRWQTVLTAIFWPSLEAICARRRKWDLNEPGRWSNVVYSFLHVIRQLDPSQRPERLAQKVINDTAHRLHQLYLHTWVAAERETLDDPFVIEEAVGGLGDVDFEGIDRRERAEIEIARFRRHLQEGCIDEADFALLVGTRVYGETVEDFAQQVGLEYEAAKKRRQRAEAAIREAEKKLQKNP